MISQAIEVFNNNNVRFDIIPQGLERNLRFFFLNQGF